MSEGPPIPMNGVSETNSRAKNLKQDTVEYDLSESRCGFLGCYSSWFQILASKKVYVLVYGLLGMNEAMIGSYNVSTITTLEKRFKLPSTYSGVVMSAWDIGSLTASMLIAYYGSAGHKTRWVAYSSFLAAFSCLIRIIPHLLYGAGEDSYKPTEESTGGGFTNGTEMDPLCYSSHHQEDHCSLNHEGSMTIVLTFIAQLMVGVGTSAYYTLGAAYLDDNVKKNKFPFLSGISACFRWIGPTFGYVLASFTLKRYINPDVTPPFGDDDSRWIGSWYLGWIPIVFVELFFAICMGFFPRTLPREAIRRQSSKDATKLKKKTSFKDFVQTSKRLFTNRILMLNTGSGTFYMFGMMGYWLFMPKYIETQFLKSASEANLIAGTVGLTFTAVGLLSSGAIISRLKPRPTYLALWNVFTELIDVIGHMSFAFISCQMDDLHGSIDSSGSWLLNQTCNALCNCSSTIPYVPVCAEDGSQMYFSACHAGCLGTGLVNGTKVYTNCSCVGGSGIALAGPCPIDCEGQFQYFVIILSIMRFLSSTGRAGNIVIQYRSVAPEDKSVSIAFTEVAFCAFAFIPAPIIFGMIIDSTCQVWGYTCGERGNCLLYYGKDLRYLLNFTAVGCLLIGLLLDVGVLFSVGSLKIYDDKESAQLPPTETIESGEDSLKNVAQELLSEEPNELDNEENENDGTREENAEKLTLKTVERLDRQIQFSV